jgi:hypothetical protein
MIDLIEEIVPCSAPAPAMAVQVVGKPEQGLVALAGRGAAAGGTLKRSQGFSSWQRVIAEHKPLLDRVAGPS